MKNTFIALSIVSVLTISCSTQNKISRTETQKNIITEVMLGEVNGEDLKDNPLFPNTKMHYSNYEVDKDLAKIIVENEDGLTVKVVFGPWCGDSKRNVPQFQKIVDVSGFDKTKIKYVAVDRNKEGGSYNVSALSIKRVPTFIFYRNNDEIGRIIENPTSDTIEQDWVKIVTSEDIEE